MSLNRNYKFELANYTTVIEVIPDNDNIIIAGRREKNRGTMLYSLKDPLEFSGSTFAWIMHKENTPALRCGGLTLTITKRSDSSNVLTGKCAFDDIDFSSIGKCIVSVPFAQHGLNGKLQAIMKKETNILNNEKTSVNGSFASEGFSTIETKSFKISYDGNLPSDFPATGISISQLFQLKLIPNEDRPYFRFNDGWHLLADETFIEKDFYTGALEKRYTFKREITTSPWTPATFPLNTSQWEPVYISGNTYYCRKIRSEEFVEKSYEESPNINLYGTDLFAPTHYEAFWLPEIAEIDNGIELRNAFSKLLVGSGISISSHYFSINPSVGAAPANAAYTYASDNLNEIVLWISSSIIRHDAAMNATIWNYTLERLLELLSNKYSASWALIGNKLVVEHETFFDGNNGIDLVALSAIGTEGTGYNYDTQANPPFETWSDLQGQSPLFGDEVMDYTINPPQCERVFSESNQYRAECYTDLNRLIARPSSVEDKSVFLAQTFLYNSKRYFNAQEYRPNFQASMFNNVAIAQLFNWNRYAETSRRTSVQDIGGLYGLMTYNHESTVKRKKETPVKARLANGYEADLENKVKTRIGWGKVESSEYSLKSCILELSINH